MSALSLVIIHGDDGRPETVTLGGVSMQAAEWRHDARAGLTVARVEPAAESAWQAALRRWLGEGAA